MIETSETIKALTLAILKVQGDISGVKRDGKNPHFKNRYATLENVIDTARPALQEARIAFVQAPGLVVDGSVEVTTMLVHETGEWMRSTLHVPLGKRDAQGVGSAITYGARYSLMAMLGLPPTDDDGHAASQPFQPAVRDEDDNRKTSGSVSFAEMKRGLAAIDEDLLDCHTIADVNKCARIWATMMDQQEWTPVYRDEAKPKFERRRADITKGYTKPAEDAILDQFPGSKVVSNSYVRALEGG